jgi:hypothetical protein
MHIYTIEQMSKSAGGHGSWKTGEEEGGRAIGGVDEQLLQG